MHPVADFKIATHFHRNNPQPALVPQSPRRNGGWLKCRTSLQSPTPGSPLELLRKNIAVMRRQLECEFCEEILRNPYTCVPKDLPACAILIMYPSTGLSTVTTHYA
jgi:hypothetical protein